MTLEQTLGAAVSVAGAAFVVLSVVLSAGGVQGCGPCWPGPCADATPEPTPTPTPSPTALPDCTITFETDRVVQNLWQRNTTDCPRLLLDPTNPDYDDDQVCEVGSGSEDNFTFRYGCNANDPWALAVAVPGTAVVDGSDVEVVTLARDCPTGVPSTQNFVLGTDLEPILWETDQVEVEEVADSWREGCLAEDATDSRLEACREVCAGSLSLREALIGQGISTSDAVNCYLALYDPTFPVHTGEESIDSTNEMFSLLTACTCMPSTDFLDCIIGEQATEACLVGTTYDELCGEICFLNNPTEESVCNEP